MQSLTEIKLALWSVSGRVKYKHKLTIIRIRKTVAGVNSLAAINFFTTLHPVREPIRHLSYNTPRNPKIRIKNSGCVYFTSSHENRISGLSCHIHFTSSV